MIRPALFALLALCGEAHAGSLEAHVLSPAGAPVEDAAVVAEPIGAVAPRHPRASATVEQRDRELNPYVSIVQTGTAVDFPNRDPFKHHLYSFSPAKIFEIKLYAGKPAQPVIFDKPGEVALGCNIHDWMEAYVLVVNSPYFAKTDRRGRALIANVPPGRYRMHTWHPRQRQPAAPSEIEIRTKPAKLNLVMEVAPRILKPKPPIDADHY